MGQVPRNTGLRQPAGSVDGIGCAGDGYINDGLIDGRLVLKGIAYALIQGQRRIGLISGLGKGSNRYTDQDNIEYEEL